MNSKLMCKACESWRWFISQDNEGHKKLICVTCGAEISMFLLTHPKMDANLEWVKE